MTYAQKFTTRSPLVNIIMEAMHKAAPKLVRDFSELDGCSFGGNVNAFVSKGEQRVERMLQYELENACPGYNFIMEEGGRVDQEGSKFTWIIDPLDGSTNFAHNIPHFAISVAIAREGKVIAGAVYDPIKNEMFWAATGMGAFLNNRRIRVGQTSDLNHAILGDGLGRSQETLKMLESLSNIRPRIRSIRRMGSVALDLAYVAAGRFDLYGAYPVKIWDIAAGQLIVQEAGGIIKDGNLEPFTLESDSIFASNYSIFEGICKV